MIAFALLCLSPICSPLEFLVPKPSYLASHVAATARPLEITTVVIYLALCAMAAIRNRKRLAILVLIAGLMMSLITFARFIETAGSTGEI
jgi:hypothetical protein